MTPAVDESSLRAESPLHCNSTTMCVDCILRLIYRRYFSSAKNCYMLVGDAFPSSPPLYPPLAVTDRLVRLSYILCLPAREFRISVRSPSGDAAACCLSERMTSLIDSVMFRRSLLLSVRVVSRLTPLLLTADIASTGWSVCGPVGS